MITELSLYSIAEHVAEQLELGHSIEQIEGTFLSLKEKELRYHKIYAEQRLIDYGIFEILETLKQSNLKFDYADANSVYIAFYQYQLQQLNENLVEMSNYTKKTVLTKENAEFVVDTLMKAGYN